MSITKLTAALVVPAFIIAGASSVGATGQSHNNDKDHKKNSEKKDCPPKEKPVTPVYACKLLTVTLGVDRAVNAKVDVVAENGATVNNVSYNFGDGSAPVVTTGGPADHKYASDGTYKVVATVTFNTGKTTATSNCGVDVTIKMPETPQTLPATTTLPNTGVGSVAGLFAGVTGLGTAAHAIVARRRG